MRWFAVCFVGIMLAVGLGTHTKGGVILDLAHPTKSPSFSASSGSYSDYSIVLDMVESVDVESAGMAVDPHEGSTLLVSIYELTGQDGLTRSPILASNSITITESTFQFYDISIAYLLEAGKRYEFAFTQQPTWNGGGWEYFFLSPLQPYTVENKVSIPYALFDGNIGDLIPHVRLNVVPEPSIALFVIIGVLSLLFIRRK